MTHTPKPLSGQALLDTLTHYFKHFDFSTLKQKRRTIDHDIEIIYVWCNEITRFINFAKTEMKLSVPTSYHDAIKYLINLLFFNKSARLEVCENGMRFDLVDDTDKSNEVKTLEYIEESDFRKKLSLLMVKAQDQADLRKIWWICFLHQAKTIKGRVCVYFLGFIRMNAENLKVIKGRKAKTEILNKIISEQKDMEREIIEEENIDPEELENEFLFGVENAIVSNLRSDVIKLVSDLERAEQEKQRIEREKQTIESEKQRIEREKQTIESEKQRIEQQRHALELENKELREKLKKYESKNTQNV